MEKETMMNIIEKKKKHLEGSASDFLIWLGKSSNSGQ